MQKAAVSGQWQDFSLSLFRWGVPLVLAVGLIEASLYSHPLFHTLAELFSVTVAVLLALLAWQTFPFSRNHFLMYLAAGYFWIGMLDLAHALTHQGLGLFPGDLSTRSIQFWIGARYLEALALLSAPLFLTRSFAQGFGFAGFGAAAVGLSLLIMGGHFPEAYVAGQGLTPFKIYSEYLIIGLLLLAAVHLWRRSRALDRDLLVLLAASIVCTILAEFTFTFYVTHDGLETILGHLFKFFSFWLIFIAVISTILSEPFRILARDASTFDAVPDPTVVIDREGIVRQANRAARRIAGQGCIDRPYHGLLCPESIPLDECPVCRRVAEGRPIESLEVHFEEPERWIEFVLSPIGPGQGMVLVFRDQTERRSAEQRLRCSEARLAEAQRIADLGAWEWEVDSGRLYWSDELFRLFGEQPDSFEPTYERYLQFIHPEDRQMVQKRIAAACDHDEPCQVEYRIVLADGSEKYARAQGRVERDASGRARRMVGVCQDISRSKAADLALRESEEYYRVLFNNSSDALFVHPLLPDGETGSFVNVNEVACQRLGYTREELLGMSARDLNDSDSHVPDAKQSFLEDDQAIFETTHRTKDGRRIPVEVTARKLQIRGHPYVLSTARDITERKKAEAALRESEQKNRTLLENLPQYIFLKDRNSVYLSCNMNFARLFGLSPEELVGKTPHDIHPKALADKYRRDELRIMERGKTEHLIEPALIRGEELIIHTVKTPVRNDEGVVTGVLAIFWDVTEQHKAEAQLIESRQLLAEAEEIANLGSWRWDVDSGRLEWSEGMYRIAGLDPLGFVPTFDRVLEELVFDADRERTRRLFAQAVIDGSDLDTEFRMRCGDELRSVHLKAKPKRNDTGDVIGLVGTTIDITERTKTEKALLEAHDQLEGIFSNLHIHVAYLDPQFNFIRVNAQYAQALGCKPSELAGRNLFELRPAAAARGLFEQVVKSGKAYTVYADSSGPIGVDFVTYWDWSLYPIKDAKGQVSGLLLTQVDVTERRLAEQALMESELRYRAIMENAIDAILVADEQGRFIDANRRAEQLLGYSKWELLQMGPPDIHPPEEQENLRTAFRQMAEEGHSLFEHLVLRKDGSVAPVEVAGTQIHYAGRNIFLGTFRDTAERKRIEQELHQYRHHLELLVEERTRDLSAMNRELESFSYSVSHDLRAPLRAINGFGQALLEDFGESLNEIGRSYLDRMRLASSRMSQLIDGLLILSRVIRKELKCTELDLSEVAREVVTGLKEDGAAREVEFRIEPGLSARGDPTLIRLLLQNLLGNAWKFTSRQPEALIEFGRLSPEAGGAFFVRDNGVGFEMEYASKLFQPFQRLHTIEEYEGTGIGLATVNRIIQRHGGSVWAEGNPGEGTVIYFTLAR